ncbi:ABC transporter substrate-binding protein [Candidatus Poriferisocius sp.]|uniref:ABC transporter substrate-binding protein n=1 Tax=Candidatus Poriferisocius sp. TaxID=3101276 RepID=UPI003B59E597
MIPVKAKSWIAALLLMMLIAAACSSDNDDDAAVPADAAPTTAPARPDDDPANTEDDSADDSSAGDGTVDSDSRGDDVQPGDSGADGDQTDSAEPEPGEPTNEVTQVLKIGYAYPDVAAFAVLHDKFSIGDPEIQAASVLQGWRRDGILPVNGIDIEIVYGKYNILSSDDKIGVCTQFAEDDNVFAVIAGRDFQVGSECLAARFGIPVIDSSGLAPSTYQRTAPWLFTVRASEAQVLERFVAWADERGALDGKRIGVFWDTRSEEAVDQLRVSLAAVGQEIASDLPSDGEGIGSPQDQIVVQRFVSDDVDFAILLVSTSSVTNFLASAESQGYEPDLLAFEWANQLTDVSTQSYPQLLIDGMEAMAMGRLGEIAAGFDQPPQALRCIENYEAYSGEEVSLVSPESGETIQTLFTCDLMALLLEGLKGAGPSPSPESFVAALETVTDFPLSLWGNLTWTPDDHAGIEQVRTVVWSTTCECWTAQGEFSDPLD